MYHFLTLVFITAPVRKIVTCFMKNPARGHVFRRAWF